MNECMLIFALQNRRRRRNPGGRCYRVRGARDPDLVEVDHTAGLRGGHLRKAIVHLHLPRVPVQPPVSTTYMIQHYKRAINFSPRMILDEGGVTSRCCKLLMLWAVSHSSTIKVNKCDTLQQYGDIE